EQTYQCPQGQRLRREADAKARRSGPEYLQRQRYRCPPEHGTTCPLRQRCAKNPQAGRTISRSEYEEDVEALRLRMGSPEAKALYRLRRQTVELVNADWKTHRRLRRFSARGLARVRGQVGLLVLTHNLLTLLAQEKKVQPKEAVLVANPAEVAA